MKNHLLNSVLNKLRQFPQFWLYHLFYLKCAMLNNVKNKSGSNQMRISCCLRMLPIESGRYKKIHRVERLYSLCNRSEIGDEFHYC